MTHEIASVAVVLLRHVADVLLHRLQLGEQLAELSRLHLNLKRTGLKTGLK